MATEIMSSRSNRISIIIPTFNRRELVANLLEDLRNQSVLPDEVILVDAGTIPCTPVPPQPYNLQYVRNFRDNLASSYNLGISKATYPLICFLDDDVSLPKSWLAKMDQLISHNPKAVAWGGPAVVSGSRRTLNLLSEQSIAAKLLASLYDLFLLSGRAREVGVLTDAGAYSFGSLNPDDVYPDGFGIPVGSLSNANLVARRDALERIHGFDEGFNFSYQEGDLYLRLRDCGGVLVIGPQPYVYHHVAGEGNTRRLEPHSRDFEYYLQKLKTRSPTIRVRWQLALFRVGYVALLLRSSRGRRSATFIDIIKGLERGRREYRLFQRGPKAYRGSGTTNA